MGDAPTWGLIHKERAAMADTLNALTASQWSEPSLVAGWSVQVTAAHIVNGAEQTPGHFMARMAANGFRFNKAMDRDARRSGALAPAEIVERLRARTTTTNHPPAPVMAMLGEIVVHAEDIRHPLGLESDTSPDAIVACLEMYAKANFPVGGKKRIDGLRLVATDIDWSHGTGPEVSGLGLSLVMAMTGRPAGLDRLTGDGLATLRSRVAPPG
ncbi:MAG: hypothetical protein QOD72_3150 [Acidimicrobiaceae bacterium]|jgi:uncharacterized protein (TIGR03083 family)|nr:hypothetical protein [Acidimicrobiaceae bacterium]